MWVFNYVILDVELLSYYIIRRDGNQSSRWIFLRRSCIILFFVFENNFGCLL